MPRTLISIATYNERQNLPGLVAAIFSHLPESDLLIVDDHSPDGTGEWAASHAEQDSRVRVEHRAGKLGLGTATVFGLQYAIDHSYDYVVTMDADFSHDPRYLPVLLESVQDDVDVAIGSRYVRGGGVQGWPLSRRVMSRLINAFARVWLRISARDTSGAFRCYRTSTLKRMGLQQIKSRGYSVFEELLWRLQRHGATMVEVPIVFVDREQGESKISLREAVGSLSRLVSLRFQR